MICAVDMSDLAGHDSGNCLAAPSLTGRGGGRQREYALMM
jgi:hypothetical protein